MIIFDVRNEIQRLDTQRQERKSVGDCGLRPDWFFPAFSALFFRGKLRKDFESENKVKMFEFYHNNL